MSRATQWISVLCAASLLGNVWLYWELRVRERPVPHRVAALPPRAQDLSSEVNPITATTPAVAPTSVSKPTSKQTLDKCRKKFEDEMLGQLHDPAERDKLKRQGILSLQANNVGAATRLHLSEQTLNRILELQAEQDLTAQEEHFGNPRGFNAATINPQIAEEFGEVVATQWAEYSRQSSGRLAVQGVANLFAEANVPLSEDQRRRLVGIYADEFELRSAQGHEEDLQEMQDDRGNPRATANYLEKQVAKQQAFEQRVQADAASFLTPAQLELLRRKSDLESERFRSVIESIPKTEGTPPVPEFQFEC